MSDVVQVNENGTYTETSHIRETDGGTVSETDQTGSGTWDVRGNTIDLTDTNGITVSGTVNQNTLSINAGLDLVYARQ